MRRMSLPVVLTGTMMVIFGAVPGSSQTAKSSQCRTGPDDCKKNPKPEPCNVKVQLSAADGLCKVTKLEPQQPGDMSRHQIQLCSKDTVEWEFINGCGVDLDLAIDNFRLDETIVKRLISEDPTRKLTPEGLMAEPRNDGDSPFDCVRKVSVGRGKSGLVKCRVKAGAHTPRTYKYDIVRLGRGGRFVLLDPEGEIYK
jgi:hypothetical protein